jgi:hypothetical protein
MTSNIQTALPLMRQSERGVFKRCQWQWYQQHVTVHPKAAPGVVGIRPIVEKWTEAADFGTLFHVAMAEYYIPGTVRGPHPAETWARVAGEMRTKVRTMEMRDDELVAKWEDFYELGLVLAEAYVERYQGDPHWDILDAERRFEVVIPDIRVPRMVSEKGKRVYAPIVKLVGTMDLCMRDLNQEDRKGRPLIKALDHKTVGRIEVHHLGLDEQASTYIAVATHALREQGLIEQDQVVKGMEYNFIKRAALDTRPRDEQGWARNTPRKADYNEAFVAAGFEELTKAELNKLKIPDLEKMATDAGLKVYGQRSADQSGDNFRRYFVPRTPKERQRQIIRISEEARVMDDVRHGRLPVLKTPTKECRFCKFFDLCELDESGGDTEYFISTTMKPYDAYADHRENAANSKKVNDASSTPEG